jgi:hypothetical protein
MAFLGTSTGALEANCPSLLPRSVRRSGGRLASPRAIVPPDPSPSSRPPAATGFSRGFHASVTFVAVAPASLDRNDSSVLESGHNDRMPIVPERPGPGRLAVGTPMRHAMPTPLVTIEGSLTAHTGHRSFPEP